MAFLTTLRVYLGVGSWYVQSMRSPQDFRPNICYFPIFFFLSRCIFALARKCGRTSDGSKEAGQVATAQTECYDARDDVCCLTSVTILLCIVFQLFTVVSPWGKDDREDIVDCLRITSILTMSHEHAMPLGANGTVFCRLPPGWLVTVTR